MLEKPGAAIFGSDLDKAECISRHFFDSIRRQEKDFDLVIDFTGEGAQGLVRYGGDVRRVAIKSMGSKALLRLLLRPNQTVLTRDLLPPRSHHSAPTTEKHLREAKAALRAGQKGPCSSWFDRKRTQDSDDKYGARHTFTPPHDLRWLVFFCPDSDAVPRGFVTYVVPPEPEASGTELAPPQEGPPTPLDQADATQLVVRSAVSADAGRHVEVHGYIFQQGLAPVTVITAQLNLGGVAYSESDHRSNLVMIGRPRGREHALTSARLDSQDSHEFRTLWASSTGRPDTTGATTGELLVYLANGVTLKATFPLARYEVGHGTPADKLPVPPPD